MHIISSITGHFMRSTYQIEIHHRIKCHCERKNHTTGNWIQSQHYVTFYATPIQWRQFGPRPAIAEFRIAEHQK